MKSLVETYNALDKIDLRILRVMEIAHSKYIYIPYKLIVNRIRFNEKIISKSLMKLNKLKLIQRARGPYEGYRLNFRSYDVLAIHTLRKSNKIVSISPTPIGVGKESEVYVGETPSGLKAAVKLHRSGTSSFIHVKRLRSFLRDRRHLTKLYEARLAAHAEYAALSEVFDAGGHVPEPLAVNRHAVVMRYINGVELYRVELADLGAVASQVEETIEAALERGIVHGDLTPYNILIGAEGTSYIIDWPQWIPVHYPNSDKMLYRDLIILNNLFKKYNIEIYIEKFIDLLYKYRKELGKQRLKALEASVCNSALSARKG